MDAQHLCKFLNARAQSTDSVSAYSMSGTALHVERASRGRYPHTAGQFSNFKSVISAQFRSI